MSFAHRIRTIVTGSIRRRLVLSVCGLIVAVMTSFIYSIVASQSKFLEGRAEERGRALAETVAVNSASSVLTNDLMGLVEVIGSLENYPDLRYVMVLAPDGRVLAHNDPTLAGRFVTDPASRALLTGPPRSQILARTQHLLDLAAPIRAGGRLVGWVRVGLGRDTLTENLNNIKLQGLYLTCAALALGILMASVMGTSLARDLNALITVTRRVGAGDTSARAAMQRDDELGTLAGAFDSMAETWESAVRDLRTTERELRQLLVNLPVGVAIRSREGTIDYANDTGRAILGIARHELSDDQLMYPRWRYVNGDGTVMHHDEVPENRVINTKVPARDQVVGIVRFGENEPVWVHVNAYPEFDSDGTVRHVIITLLDISERKRAQELLHQRAEEFRALAENAPDPILRYDSECRRIYANPAAERLSQTPLVFLGGLMSTGSRERSAPKDSETKILALVQQVLDTNEPAEGRVEFTEANGKRRYFHNRFVPERNQKGDAVSVLSISTDITSVIEAERQFRMLVDNLPDIVTRSDREGRYLYVSPAVEKVFRIPAREFLGKTIRELATTESREVAKNIFEGVLKAALESAPNVMEVTWPLPRGVRDFEIRHIPELDEGGNVTSVLSITRDVTKRRRVEEALRKTTEELDRFFSIVVDPLSISTMDGYFLRLNPAWEQVLGYSRAEIMESSWFSYVHPDDRAATEEAMEALAKHKDVIGFVNRYRCRDGTYKWIEWNSTPAGNRIYAAARDITERVRLTQSLRQLSAAVEQSPVPVLITDVDGTIQYVNPAFSISSRYSPEELIGKKPSILKDDSKTNEEYAELWATITSGHAWRGTFHNMAKDGSRRWDEAVITPIRDEKGNITQFVGIQQDITARKKEEERAEFLAHHDALTGLPNRLLGQDRMERAIAYAERYDCKAALMFLDLDGFKRINDTLGHAIGDALLNQVAARLQIRMRRSDTIVRQGGDEFLLILSEIHDPDAIITVALATLEQMAMPFVVSGHELSVTASVGITVYPDDGRDWQTLLEKADIAMYSAKQSGRNTYRFFTAQMNADADLTLAVRTKLPSALERGELSLHYQPQFDLVSGRVTGVEALLRWTSPELGDVAPDRFLPFAEESGLIVPIGAWVLKEACHQAVAWQRAGMPDLMMAVNIALGQFRRGGLVAAVKDALAETGLDPTRLELELAEVSLIKDTTLVLDTIPQLKALGVKLAIDDFGSGYSCLSNLKRLNADRVKIDRTFIRGIVAEPGGEVVVQAVIHVARSLGLNIVAEGVENEATMAALRVHGCDTIQGFHCGVPMPPDKLTPLLAKRPNADAAE